MQFSRFIVFEVNAFFQLSILYVIIRGLKFIGLKWKIIRLKKLDMGIHFFHMYEIQCNHTIAV
jgi:hypothetical protein